jgi:hypothetical protein
MPGQAICLTSGGVQVQVQRLGLPCNEKGVQRTGDFLRNAGFGYPFLPCMAPVYK